MLNTVKLLLGITTSEQDDVLQIMIADAQSAVRDYCNRKDYPNELDYIVREAVIDAFKVNNEGDVTSIKRGDTQINYGSAITKDCFTEKQYMAMNKYKKVRID